ncbi:N-6 DNA methylase [Kitasatospora sp. NPDC049285]|uniref:N-6 DNA methylase n=1 Tax=Kitasatospora sp. NPDC049285 TaxID=3157096 RepID=UPI00342A50D4
MTAPLLPGAAPVVVPRPLPSWVVTAQQAAAEPPKPEIHMGQRRRAPFASHREIANRLAEDVTDAWFKARGGSQHAIPIGVVAALALVVVKDEAGPDLGDQFLALDPAELGAVLKDIWGITWYRHPYLIQCALPLHEWLTVPEPDPEILHAVHKTAHAAINSGLFQITSHQDPGLRTDTDVLSRLIMDMSTKAKRLADGEFHTPDPACDLMAQVLLGQKDFTPGMSFMDPAAGSGGMLRAAAAHLRDHGHDPADYEWYGNDINEIAVACLAVNSIIWGLGPNVVIAKADSLADPGWPTRARAERAEVIAHRNRVVELAATEAAHRRAIRLLTQLTEPLERTA